MTAGSADGPSGSAAARLARNDSAWVPEMDRVAGAAPWLPATGTGDPGDPDDVFPWLAGGVVPAEPVDPAGPADPGTVQPVPSRPGSPRRTPSSGRTRPDGPAGAVVVELAVRAPQMAV